MDSDVSHELCIVCGVPCSCLDGLPIYACFHECGRCRLLRMAIPLIPMSEPDICSSVRCDARNIVDSIVGAYRKRLRSNAQELGDSITVEVLSPSRDSNPLIPDSEPDVCSSIECDAHSIVDSIFGANRKRFRSGSTDLCGTSFVPSGLQLSNISHCELTKTHILPGRGKPHLELSDSSHDMINVGRVFSNISAALSSSYVYPGSFVGSHLRLSDINPAELETTQPPIIQGSTDLFNTSFDISHDVINVGQVFSNIYAALSSSYVYPDLFSHPVDMAVVSSFSSAVGRRLPMSFDENFNSPRKLKKKKGRNLLACVASKQVLLPLVGDCSYCGAIKFYHESPKTCCSDGAVTLSSSTLPSVLQVLLNDLSMVGKSFRACIRTYNNYLSFTSLGVSADPEYQHRNRGIYTFRVQGQIYHFMNSLVSTSGHLSNAQLYFYDSDYESTTCHEACSRLSEPVLASLLDMLAHNPYVQFFRSLRHIPDLGSRRLFLHADPQVDQKTFNRPTVSQVSIILDESNSGPSISNRDIRVYTHSMTSRPVSYYYACYDPLQYPLLFPCGEVGWHQGIERNNLQQRSLGHHFSRISAQYSATVDQLLENEEAVLQLPFKGTRYISIREYYAYKFHIRPADHSYLLLFGRLFQQYAVDMYVKLETQRLDYYATQQKEIRQEFLQGLVDAVVAGESEGSQIGRRIVLPGNFTGGPRNMRQKYMDAMALVQKYGKPDFFVTITCNPNWPEIMGKLKPFEECQNRPDLVARVFKAKFEILKSELLVNHCLGEVQAYTYVVEYQKRGLPHIHMLLIMKKAFKLYRPDEYDILISAEIPDKKVNSYLYDVVVKHMLHGPCGKQMPKNVCMRKSGECRNSYPREFCETTTLSVGAYPLYRRRNNGVRVLVSGCWLDNRWIVPHSPYLVALLNCHINIEICSNIKAVKYIYKYICKGNDKILFRVADADDTTPVNEITNFQSARWISAPEALWRIFRFSMSDMNPPFVRLPLHLENYQPLNFNKKQRLLNILANPQNRKTMLTEFFHMNMTSAIAQRLQCTYNEFPDHFVWVPSNRSWKIREQKKSIGRIITAQPTDVERYYLRLLLSRVRCPTSYLDLRTYNGVVSSTFREAALSRGFLENDVTQELCLREAAVYKMPYELRRLFSTLLVLSCPADPKKLWLLFEDDMSEDYRNDVSLSTSEIQQKVLQQISDFLQVMGSDIASYGILPSNVNLNDIDSYTREMNSELHLPISASDLQSRGNLNSAQSMIFNIIMDKIQNNQPGAFFVDGLGGTGKTYLYRALLATLRSKGYVALATASSGIAASNLPGGRTAHSRFKIPLDLSGGSTCHVSKQSGLDKLIIESKLIIWDEAPMCKRDAIEALDILLRDLMSTDLVFGGKVIVFGGDFRQTLPIVQYGTKSTILSACLRASPLWSDLTKLNLTENIRARLDPAFTEFLLSVGNGSAQSTDSDLLQLPDTMLLKNRVEPAALEELIGKIYPDLNHLCSDLCLNKVILTTKNSFVEEINNQLIADFPGLAREYLSFDEAINIKDKGQFEELINTLTPTGLPPHNLTLKINAPIILLRNINPIEGLCNGTRLYCLALDANVVKAEISFGDFKGKIVFIHRIPMEPGVGDNYPVPYKRTQFPLRLCFAMTINKSQGQTLDLVGLYLKEPVFSHGQLYVALSRANAASNLYVYIKPSFCDPDTSNRTVNIVYKEVLTDD